VKLKLCFLKLFLFSEMEKLCFLTISQLHLELSQSWGVVASVLQDLEVPV